MAPLLRTVYLLWLPIAVFAVAIRASDESGSGLSSNHILARDALAEQIAAIKSQYGDSADVSLEGYDHDLLINSNGNEHGLNEQPDEDSPHAPLLLSKKSIIMPESLMNMIGALSKRASRNPKIAELNADKAKVKAALGNDVDTNLDGYDAALLDDDDDGDTDFQDIDNEMEKRATREPKVAELNADKAKVEATLGSQVDTNLDGYDTALLDEDEDEDEDEIDEHDEDIAELEKRASRNPRIIELNADAAKVKAALGKDVDINLDGYDTAALDEVDDDEDVETYTDDEVLRRDVPETESEYLAAWDSGSSAIEAQTGPGDNEPDVNDRYAESAISYNAEKLKRDAAEAADEAKKEAKGWFESLKAIVAGAAQAV